MDFDLDLGIDFIKEEDLKRFDSLSQQNQKKFADLFSSRAEEKIDDLGNSKDSDTLDKLDVNEIFRKIFLDCLDEVEGRSWRGLDLLKDPNPYW